jgi:hypothetical protein
MAIEGYGLENQEEETKTDDEVIAVPTEDKQPIEEETIKEEIDINGIINKRNKLHSAYRIKIPIYSEDVGRINLDIFGDPEAQDSHSLMAELELELRHPANKRHPLARHFHNFKDKIKEIQILYERLNMEYGKYIRQYSDLLDTTIEMFQDKEEKYLNEIEFFKKKLQPPTTEKVQQLVNAIPPSRITKKIVNEYLDTIGNKYIETYFESKRAGNKEYTLAKGHFIQHGRNFFAKYHTDPKWFAEQLWKYKTKDEE